MRDVSGWSDTVVSQSCRSAAGGGGSPVYQSKSLITSRNYVYDLANSPINFPNFLHVGRYQGETEHILFSTQLIHVVGRYYVILPSFVMKFQFFANYSDLKRFTPTLMISDFAQLAKGRLLVKKFFKPDHVLFTCASKSSKRL